MDKNTGLDNLRLVKDNKGSDTKDSNSTSRFH
jgi:hypothetical protein